MFHMEKADPNEIKELKWGQPIMWLIILNFHLIKRQKDLLQNLLAIKEKVTFL